MQRPFSKELTVNYNQNKHKLFWAVDNNNIDYIQEMIDDEENDTSFLATKNISGLSALHYAIKFCKVDTLYFLLAKAGNSLINLTDDDGNTLLHTAINTNDLEKVQAIINYNPNLTIKNNEKLTPICLAKQIKNLNQNIKFRLKEYIKNNKNI